MKDQFITFIVLDRYLVKNLSPSSLRLRNLRTSCWHWQVPLSWLAGVLTMAFLNPDAAGYFNLTCNKHQCELITAHLQTLRFPWHSNHNHHGRSFGDASSPCSAAAALATRSSTRKGTERRSWIFPNELWETTYSIHVCIFMGYPFVLRGGLGIGILKA